MQQEQLALNLKEPRIAALCAAAPRMGALIARVGKIKISLVRDLFVGQPLESL